MWLRFRRSCCCVLSPFLPEDKSLLICTLNLTHFTTYLWKTAVFRCTLSNPSAKRCMPPRPHPKPRPPPHPKLRRKLPEFSRTNPDESVWKISSEHDSAIFFSAFSETTIGPFTQLVLRPDCDPRMRDFQPKYRAGKGTQKLEIVTTRIISMIKGVYMTI